MDPAPAPTPPPPPPRWIGRSGLIGLSAALAYALILYGLTKWLQPEGGMAVLSFLLGAPAAACGLAVILDDPTGRGGGVRHLQMAVLVISAILVMAGVMAREGAVCLVMAFPLFYGFGVIGALVAGWLARTLRRGRTYGLAFIALPLIGLPAEDPRAYPTAQEYVTTSVDIAASPAAVWRQTVAIPAIRPDERIATFSHDVVGTPRPVEAVLEGAGVGAVRHLAWTRGVRFEEVVTGWDQDRALAWRFRFWPGSVPREIERNIDVQSRYLWISDGAYRLDPIAGGTRLTLTTHYRLTTPINGYAAAWGRVFFSDFHSAVLHVIKERSEARDG